MSGYKEVLIFIVSAMILSVMSQGTSQQSSSNCVYTFHVPKNELGDTCTKQNGIDDQTSLKKRLDILESVITNQQQQLSQYSATITTQQQQLTLMSTSLNKYLIDGSGQKQYASGNQSVGVNYIRYGHKSCPDTGKKVYDGFVGKSDYTQPGGGSNYLCLPRNPEWPTGSAAGFQSQSYLFGVEYQKQNSPLMPISKHDNDVPCAVFEVVGRSQKMMIPAKKTCPDEWTKEYEGILMAPYYTQFKSDFACIDIAMQTITGGKENKDGGLLYIVEAVCGSLPCPPYIDGYEIACVVCTK